MTRSSKIKKKIKKLNGRKSYESFVQIPKYMKESSGYKHLVLNCTGALTVYIDLADRYNGINNGEISYSVREGKESLGLTPNTVGKYLKALERYGLIITTQKGCFNLKKRHASTYEITMWSVEGKHKAKKNFMHYKPTPEELKLFKDRTTVIPNKYQKSVSNNNTHRYQKPILKEANGHFTVSKIDT